MPTVTLCPCTLLFPCAHCSSAPILRAHCTTVSLYLLFPCAHCSSMPTVPLCLSVCAHCTSGLLFPYAHVPLVLIAFKYMRVQTSQLLHHLACFCTSKVKWLVCWTCLLFISIENTEMFEYFFYKTSLHESYSEKETKDKKNNKHHGRMAPL